MCQLGYGQDRKKSDSLLDLLKAKNFTKKERANLLESISFYHPKLDSALYFAQESLKVSKEIDSRLLEAQALESIGMLEQRLGNYSNALSAAFEALTIYEELNLIDNQAAVQAQIATVYAALQEYQSSITYLKKTASIYKDLDEKIKYALTLINLGESYRVAGMLDLAETTLLDVLELNKVLDIEAISGYTSGNLGMVYASKNEFEKAKNALKKAINILKILQDDYCVSIYLAELGDIYKKEGNHDLAEKYLLEAFKIAKKIGLKEQIQDFSKTLVLFNQEKQDYKEAFKYQNIYQTYHDSLVNKENIKKVEQLKAGYIINKRELEIERINEISATRKNIVIGLSVVIVLFIVLSYLLYRLYNRIRIVNADLSKKEKEKAFLLKELNHRVKNNLQMVSSLLNLQSRSLSENSDKEIIVSGKNRVEALSLVHSKLYQEGLETKINLKEYVEELVLNLIYGFGVELNPKFNIDPINIDVNKAIPIALILNEIVTNAIKHAYKDNPNPKLEISALSNEKGLHVEVSDNGKGFGPTERQKKNSLGLQLINSLIDQLDGSVNIESNEGTQWKINLVI
ncbi:tetratricopeptide repeat-containing sensor histidine kinase [Pseudotamlana haliotis]|uniref:tetratricopeptide repeat-containing sensor histidine kinase n=1 Tax=Pseudotamlana haliotis TaxID=2614804 RepID=UPI0017870E83|nr:tetratricopeptide repeat protein [Tamlana haliotis]